MNTISTWALRIQAGADGEPLSDEQIENWQRWGVLRDPPDGRWSQADVARARQIREMGRDVRSIPRRAVRLFDLSYPTSPGKLRESMIAVAKSTSAPVRKMSRIASAVRLHYGDERARSSRNRSRPEKWRIPSEPWESILGRFNDDDFRLIAGSELSQARSLTLNPTVTKSGVLAGIPFEEIAVLLTIHQLTIADDMEVPFLTS